MRFFLFIILFQSTLGFGMSPEKALQQLIKGNERFAKDKMIHTMHESRRLSTVESQKPFAVILTCSDSRVPVEILFDQGIGDLFAIRVAGNVLDPVVFESVEFATTALGSSLVIVMGHENCGAVNAAFTEEDSLIPEIATRIDPAIQKAKTLEDAVIDNARYVASELQKIPSIQQKIRSKSLQIVPAYYSFQTGKVRFF